MNSKDFIEFMSALLTKEKHASAEDIENFEIAIETTQMLSITTWSSEDTKKTLDFLNTFIDSAAHVTALKLLRIIEKKIKDNDNDDEQDIQRGKPLSVLEQYVMCNEAFQDFWHPKGAPFIDYNMLLGLICRKFNLTTQEVLSQLLDSEELKLKDMALNIIKSLFPSQTDPNFNKTIINIFLSKNIASYTPQFVHECIKALCETLPTLPSYLNALLRALIFALNEHAEEEDSYEDNMNEIAEIVASKVTLDNLDFYFNLCKVIFKNQAADFSFAVTLLQALCEKRLDCLTVLQQAFKEERQLLEPYIAEDFLNLICSQQNGSTSGPDQKRMKMSDDEDKDEHIQIFYGNILLTEPPAPKSIVIPSWTQTQAIHKILLDHYLENSRLNFSLGKRHPVNNFLTAVAQALNAQGHACTPDSLKELLLGIEGATHELEATLICAGLQKNIHLIEVKPSSLKHLLASNGNDFVETKEDVACFSDLNTIHIMKDGTDFIPLLPNTKISAVAKPHKQ